MVEEELEPRAGKWTVIGARVGVGPKGVRKGCITFPPGTGATCDPVALIGEKGS